MVLRGDLREAIEGLVTTGFEFYEADRDWVRRAERALTELEKTATSKERLDQLRPALERAASLRDRGKRGEAERIWSALEELYRGDPAEVEIRMEIARERKK